MQFSEVVYSPDFVSAFSDYIVTGKCKDQMEAELKKIQDSGTSTYILHYWVLSTLQAYYVMSICDVTDPIVFDRIKTVFGLIFTNTEEMQTVLAQSFSVMVTSKLVKSQTNSFSS
jgi:hypothetical protein